MIDTKSFHYAIIMENSIEQEFAHIMQHVPVEQPAYRSAVSLLLKLQALFKLDVQKARDINAASQTYPQLDIDALVGSDDEWEQVSQAFAASASSSANLAVIWMIYALIERSGQFYQQAANNSAYPSARIFLNSLFQVKNILRRRIGSILRLLYNSVWEEIGFAPFLLGKD